jgi:hypothetical protein
MEEFHERRRARKFLHSRYAIAFLLIVAAILVRGLWGVWGKYQKSQALLSSAQNDLSGIEERQKTLSQAVSALSTDEGKERELRDRFALVKPGEHLVVLVDNAAAAEPAVQSVEKGWWARFWGMFGI